MPIHEWGDAGDPAKSDAMWKSALLREMRSFKSTRRRVDPAARKAALEELVPDSRSQSLPSCLSTASQSRISSSQLTLPSLPARRDPAGSTGVIKVALCCRNVIQRRVKEGKPNIPLYCFVHGTALKMYRWELGGKSPEEFPMRFHKWIVDEKLFDDQVNGVNACFVISQEQKGGIAEIFPSFPQSRVIVAPNGINVEKFRPREKTFAQVLRDETKEILWPASPSDADLEKFKRCVSFVGKAAEWKRQAALLEAAAVYEKEFPDVVTLCVGTGPDDEIAKLKSKCEELGLKNTYLLGPRSQDILAELYTVSELGVFPSFKEPFGLVFVECMACRTPVIGANSGGPKDFVTTSVGELVDEPEETVDLSTVPLGIKTLGKTLTEAIGRSLKDNWKKTKGDACIKLAHDKFTVEAQVKAMLIDVKALK